MMTMNKLKFVDPYHENRIEDYFFFRWKLLRSEERRVGKECVP